MTWLRPRRAACLVVLAVPLAVGGGCGPAKAQFVGTPASSTPSTVGSPSAAPPASPSASPSPAATTTAYAFPVPGNVSYGHTHHDYPATDIIAPCGTSAHSPVNGTVLEVTRVDTYNPKVNAGATRGGLSVSILGDDGVRYYESHFSKIDDFVQPGVRVKAGQEIAKVGETGDASACHVHFGISPPCARTGDWWIRRGVIWPWPYLDSWRANGSKSPVAEVTAWQARNGCSTSPPPGA